MRRPKYRLSPNEVERLVKEDQERRRKLRLVQVREQSKANASVIRNDVRREKERLLNNFAAEIKEKLVAEKEEKARKLEQKYENTLRAIGEGHREALINGDDERQAEKFQKKVEDAAAAEERYKLAVERQRKEDLDKEYEKTKHIISRQAALEKERQRAAEIACLPPPPPDISVELEKIKKRAIPMTDMKAFAATHFHIPEYQVVRAGSEEQLSDARLQAQDTDLRLSQDLEEKTRSHHERIERARIRGNEALQKEFMKHEYENMLKDLSLLQKKDRRWRKKMLANIPKQVFAPTEMLIEERKERQRQMEDQFNEMLMQNYEVEPETLKRFKSPERLTAYDVQSSPGSEAGAADELSIPLSRVNPALRDLTNFSKPAQQSTEMKKPETVLKQLLNRIKDQRDGPLTNPNAPLTNPNAPPSGAVKERLLSHKELQARIEAGNKASWERAHQGSPEFVVAETGLKARPRGQSGPAVVEDSGPGLAKGSDTERMIEELKGRIDLIESQKLELAEQIKVQSSFYSNLRAECQESTAGEDSSTLEEVDIDSFNSSRTERSRGSDNSSKVVSQGTKESHTNFNMATGDDDETSSSVSWPALKGRGWDAVHGSSLKHNMTTGVGLESYLGAQRAGQLTDRYKLREMLQFDGGDSGHVDRGQPPSFGDPQHFYQPASLGKQYITSLGYGTMGTVDNEEACGIRSLRHGGNLNPESLKHGGNLDAGSLKHCGNLNPESLKHGGNLDAGSLKHCGNLNPESLKHGGNLDAGSLKHCGNLNPESLKHGGNLNVGSLKRGGNLYAGSQHSNLYAGPGLAKLGHSDDLARKVREYTESASKRLAGVDADTMRRVREYQEGLIQANEERRKYLADVRSDIEHRQQELSTSRPGFGLEGSQKAQAVVGDFSAKRDWQNSLSTGQGKFTDQGSGSSVAGAYQRWSLIQPAVTGSGALGANLAALQGIVEISGRGEVKTLAVGGESSDAARKQDMQMTTKVWQNGGNKRVVDTVRKSLSFDDAEESFHVGDVSWKDLLNDAENTPCSQAFTEDSKLTSSEEDRGSPVLPQGSFEMSDKSSSSGDTSWQLSGSALIVQAQERKVGFEHRQEELQNQLVEIQRQKDAIMQTYHAGQKALQHRQATLMSKLATASALASEENAVKPRVEVRAKLADIRSQIDADAKARTTHQQTGTAGKFAAFGHGKEPNTSSPQNAAVLDEAYTKLTFNRAVEPAAGQNKSGTPVNTSSDSYLAEISFHKIATSDDQNLSSAFHSIGPGSASMMPMSRAFLASQQSQPQTWASILSLSASSRPQQQQWPQRQATHGDSVKDYSYADQPTTYGYQGQDLDNLKESEPSLSANQSLTRDKSVHKFNDQLTSPHLSPSVGVGSHQPHELSTIMEVDTPSSSSAKTSTARLVPSTNTTGSSTNGLSSLVGTNMRVDIFMDLPYTFRESRASGAGPSGAIYNLSLGQTTDTDLDSISRSTVSFESGLAGHQKPAGAKRSLDFSEQISAISMPALVELTPRKAGEGLDYEELGEKGFEPQSMLSHSCSDSGEPSLTVSGYSSYLRSQEGKGALEESADSYLRFQEGKGALEESADSYLRFQGGKGALEESADSYLRFQRGKGALEESGDSSHADNTNCEASVVGYSEGAGACKSDAWAGHSQKVLGVSQQPQKVLGVCQQPHGYGQEVVESLRKKSELVFGEVSKGESSYEISELGLSSVASDLEQVSIPETD